MKYIKLYEDIDWNENKLHENINWEDWNIEEEEDDNEYKIINLDKRLPNKKQFDVENFKVDDRIKILYKDKSYYATIIHYEKNHYFTLEFDNDINGHNAGGNGKWGHCWNIIITNNTLAAIRNQLRYISYN
jgi:hypothetical protein